MEKLRRVSRIELYCGTAFLPKKEPEIPKREEVREDDGTAAIFGKMLDDEIDKLRRTGK